MCHLLLIQHIDGKTVTSLTCPTLGQSMVVDEVQSHATTIVKDDDVTVLSTIVMFLLFIHNYILQALPILMCSS